MLVIVPLFLSSGSSLAQGSDDTQRVEFQKRTVIDLSDAVIEGQLVRPDGSYIVNRKLSKFSNLIQIRQDYVPELLGSHRDI